MMFFIGILGIGDKEKVISQIPNIRCKACGSIGQYTVVKKYNYFHIFFIPLWKWAVEYYVRERMCQTVFKLDLEIGKSIEEGMRDEFLFEEMEELYPATRCDGCGRALDEKFIYCPYCSKERDAYYKIRR